MVATLCVVLLTSCSLQRYAPLPPDPVRVASRVASGRLDDAHHLEVLDRLAVAAPAPGRPWPVNTLGLVATVRSEAVAAAAAQVVAAAAERRVAAQRPNPRISIEVGRNSDRDPGDDSRWLVGPRLDFLWSPVDRQSIRSRLADSAVEGARADVVERAWEARHAALVAALDVLAAVRRDAALATLAAARAQALVVARASVAAGLAEPFEWQALGLEQSSAALDRIEARGAERLARGQLAAALALPVASLAGVALAPAPSDALPARTTVQDAALRDHPALLHALADYDRSERELELAIAAQYPEIELGPGYLFEQGDHVWSLVGGIVVPLFAHHDVAIAAAAARRDAARAAFYAAQDAVLAAVTAAWEGLEAADAAVAAARTLADDTAMMAGRYRRDEAAGLTDSLARARAEVQAAQVAARVTDFEARRARALAELEYAARTPFGDGAFAGYLEELAALPSRE